MGKALRDELPLRRALEEDGLPPRLFYMAALSACAIGVAAITLGLVTWKLMTQLPANARPQEKMTMIIFAGMFALPGALYVVLGAWIARRRKWAVVIALLLTLLDVGLLGALFFTSIGPGGSGILCAIAGMFVVALGVLGTYLARCLVAMKEAGMGKAARGNGR